jgi:glucose-1-phosphate cytidylyltransferase
MIKKAVILAGGLGTRLSEETELVPKPLVQIGGRPILWHIMSYYSHFGVNDFVICLGYKGYMIKDFFINYHAHQSDITVNLAENAVEVHSARAEPWRVTLVDTGAATQTGGRLKRVRKYVESEPFFMTYGDGVSNVNLRDLESFHTAGKRLATVTAVRRPGRFGSLDIDGTGVKSFIEKPLGDGGWINGGFFVLSPKVLDYIEGDSVPFESEPLHNLSEEGQLSAFKHSGFWFAMDTLREKKQLEEMWESGTPPWKLWA